MTILLAALLSWFLTGLVLPLARGLGFGKSIRRDGPGSHLGKEGTPTLGGIAFLAAAGVVWAFSGQAGEETWALAAMIAASALIGLWDDLTALRRRARQRAGFASASEPTTGALARYRLAAQTGIALAFSSYAVQTGHGMFGIPLLDVAAFSFMVVGAINALNFSDGLDGLAAGMMAVMLLAFLANPLALALLGALLGFLWYNAHPAKVFMGGVGSEALGAALAGLAILEGAGWYLPLLALVPVLEVLSVILQVVYFRLTGGRRLFRMSPLHHHFEESGWPETKVVARFLLVTALCTALTVGLRGAGL